VPGILQLPKKQRRVGDAKVKPVAIALLGIISAVPRLVAVEDAGERGPAFVKVDKNARAHGRERRRRAAAQEVERSDGGPPHRGVGQDIGVLVLKNSESAASCPNFSLAMMALIPWRRINRSMRAPHPTSGARNLITVSSSTRQARPGLV
jgi:hypothetical protein